jgi:hypothetical protein
MTAVCAGGVHPGKGAVENDRALIDQDHAGAELFDVGEVVAGEHHRGAVALVQRFYQVPNGAL